MMPVFWILFWSVLSPLVCFSNSDRCTVSIHQSPLLKSLQCYNDYKSYVHCEWREHRNRTLQLWFQKDNNREQCFPYNATEQDANEHRTVRCIYKTRAFSIGIKHTVFFLKESTENLCSSGSQKPVNLSQHLRAQAPADLSTHDAEDGGQWLSWSSPYPSSSSLNENITYQLSYRTEGQESWRTENVENNTMKIEKRSLLPGCTYKARVRARVSVGHWSHWSPVVTWQTEAVGAWQSPSLRCVLVGEKEVTCSWEVNRDLAHFITHQLVCRRNQTAPPERCCVNSTVNSDLGGTVLKYSCSITVVNPAHLLVELLPTHNAKVLRANQHIRPDPPKKVEVREKGSIWVVEWTEPSTASNMNLFYQLCYCRIQDQDCPIRNISEGSLSLNIPQTSLAPLQDYQVKVRSLVSPGKDSSYRGIPSVWTVPVTWTSHDATWSLPTLIYISISMLVVTVFFIIYCTVPACQRKLVLWVDSVPSPGKSKILSEIKSASGQTLTLSEETCLCKVQHCDSISTCSSDASLWSNKTSEKKHSELDSSCWKFDNNPSISENGNSSGTSFMGFSGPYIFCQKSETLCKSGGVQCEDEERETTSKDPASSLPVNFALYGKGYVCLPSHSASRSTQDLLTCSDANTNTHSHDGAEQDHHPDTTQRPDNTYIKPSPGEPASSIQLPGQPSGPTSEWPQGGNIHASGYYQLPAGHITAQN